MTTAIEIGFSIETYNSLVEKLDLSGELYMKGDSESITSIYSGISFDSGTGVASAVNASSTGVASAVNASSTSRANIIRDVPKQKRRDVENVELEDLNKVTHR